VEIPGNDFRLRASVIALTLCTTLAAAGHAHGQTAEVSLAELYAPIVRLVEQPEECGPGEPYKPIDIDAILDEEPSRSAVPGAQMTSLRSGPPQMTSAAGSSNTTSTSRARRSGQAATTSGGAGA
jgi:hypothetical protein